MRNIITWRCLERYEIYSQSEQWKSKTYIALMISGEQKSTSSLKFAWYEEVKPANDSFKVFTVFLTIL